MHAAGRTLYQRYRPWRHWAEAGYWIALCAVNAVANSYTVISDVNKTGLPFAAWEVAVWEGSSALMWLLLVWPIAWVSRRFPFHLDTWWRQLPVHLLVSIGVSLVHVVGMVGLRTLAYSLQDTTYAFGHWPRELLYEYVKDVRTYAGMVVVMSLYRLVLRRLQGEASLLSAPDEGPPLESLERPERFLVRKLGRDFLVAAADIEWLQAAGNYVNLRVRGHDYPLRSTLAGIQERLDPRRFVRIHRSHLVALDQVASIEPMDTGDARVHMKDGSVLPCSRRYRQALRERIDGQGPDGR